MPHYHAKEATLHAKKLLGPLYRYNDSIMKCFYETVKYGTSATHVGDGVWMLGRDNEYDNYCQDDWTSSE